MENTLVARGMDRGPAASYMGGMSIGMRLFTWLHGREFGRDATGNIYYADKRAAGRGMRTRRWVMYAGPPEASAVPPEWHAWLHYTTDAPIAVAARPWLKPHQPNLTGTAQSYRPQGHDYQGGHRAAASGDYESWTPDLPTGG